MENVQPFVPQEWCLSCRGCCRFAEVADAQTPTWSPIEVAWAREGGADPAWFRPMAEAPSHEARLVPYGDGHRCPAFHPSTNRCGIYAARPLDCRLYPLVVTRDAGRYRFLLAVDTKCPYVQQLGATKALSDYGMYVAMLLESPEGQQLLASNPAIAGRPREEFWAIRPLSDPNPPGRVPAPQGFRPWQESLGPFDAALDRAGRLLSAYHRAAWWAWQDLMRLWWGSVGGADCLVAEQAGGYFLALPPFSPSVTQDVVAEVFSLMAALNGRDEVSRIEQVPAPLATRCRQWGYAVHQVEAEYVYARATVIRDMEDEARRARRRGLTSRPYGSADAEACLRLYVLWSLQRQAGTADDSAKAMLRDGYYAHRRWLETPDLLGIRGVVVEEGAGGIVGYTLGVALNAESFVIVAEVSDRAVSGTSALLTWELCRQVSHPWINTMGDAGLPSLRQAKTAGHPHAVLPVYTVTTCGRSSPARPSGPS